MIEHRRQENYKLIMEEKEKAECCNPHSEIKFDVE